MKKFFRRALTAIFIVACFISASAVNAEVKIYEGEGRYVMSEGENLGVSKERAKADAMRYACEQAGVYVKSFSRMKNFNLDEDVIETMTANILKLVEEPHFYPLETVDNLEGVLIRVTVKAQIDDADITRWLKKDSQEISTLVSQMEALRKSNDELARQIAELKKKLSAATTKADNERIVQEFAAEDKKFLSNQKVEEGWKFYDRDDFNSAVALFDEAIQLNPDNVSAWLGRGTAYDDLGQYKRAIQDYDRAIQLNPNFDKAYNNRGWAYHNLGQDERAIKDYDKTIQINPNHAYAYNNRGIAYSNLGQFELAIGDYDKAIQINPNLAEVYNNRGVSYKNLGQYELAIQNYDKAIRLNPNYATAYNNRGNVYYNLGRYERAIQDYNDALRINPNYVNAKNNREKCLRAIGR